MRTPTRHHRVIVISLTLVLKELSLSFLTVPKVFGVVAQGVAVGVD